MSNVGKYNRSRYRTIMVPTDVYVRLSLRKRDEDDSFAEVLRRVLDELDSRIAKPTAVNRIVEETQYIRAVSALPLVFVAASTGFKKQE